MKAPAVSDGLHIPQRSTARRLVVRGHPPRQPFAVNITVKRRFTLQDRRFVASGNASTLNIATLK